MDAEALFRESQERKARRAAYLDELGAELEVAPEHRKREIAETLAEYEKVVTNDPLQEFEAHSVEQMELLAATTRYQAAFCGNSFGKTAILAVKCLIQHRKADRLPEHLRRFQLLKHRPLFGRLLVPSETAMFDYAIPELQKWCPKDMYLGGSWDKAFDKQHNVLRFADDCGKLGIYTYKQDPETMAGSVLSYVAYDEPPPEPVRKECLARLLKAPNGEWFELYAMTPVNMKGGGIGWIRRTIWKKREAPTHTVVKASIHANPLLDAESKELILAEFPDDERAARESGDFLHFGGMVYDNGLEDVLVDPPEPEHVKRLNDHIVGIDPGLRHAAMVWVGFDSDGTALVYDEVRLLDKTPADYAQAIRTVNAKWGIKNPLYVIDPSARNRSLVDGRNVQGELQSFGIASVPANNAVEAGVQQVRWRKRYGKLLVSRALAALRDEAEEYRIEDRPDEVFKVVKERDHGVDALRYAVAQRPFYPQAETPKALGKPFEVRDGVLYVNGSLPEPRPESPPLGAMS